MSSTSDAGKTDTTEAAESNSAPKQKAQSIGRFSISTMMTLQIIGALILLVGINIIAFEYGKQLDFTRQSSYTLSEQTQENLKSPVIQKRDGTIKVIAVIDPREFAEIQQDSQEDIVEHVRGKLQEYVDSSDKKLSIQYVDPVIDHGITQELSERYSHTFTRSIIIIDAYDDKLLTEDYKNKLIEANPNIDEKEVLEGATETLKARHVRFLPVSELFYFDRNRNYDNQAFVAAWKDEAEITTNLMRAIEGKPKKVYFLYDKCRLDSKKNGPAPWEFIKNAYRSQNIQLEKLSLAQAKSIPDDADGIALISPSVDFTDEELLALRDYWEVRPKASILVTLDPEVHLPKLYSYLYRTSYIKPQKNRIITKENNQVLVNAEVEFLQGPQVIGDLAAKSTTFDGASQGIYIEKVSNNTNIEAFPLIKVAPGWWGETQFGTENVSYNEKFDDSAPLYLGAAVTRGKLNSQLTAPFVSKLIIIGNTDFLSVENIRDEQRQFLGQAGNWLVGREPLMNIKQHANPHRKVFIARGHSNYLSVFFTFGVPAAALIITGFVWNFRRS